MDDWDGLRFFLAVARDGSTIAASKSLGVNQSTVQRRLATFEDAIGRKLVERHPTGYRLTELGQKAKAFAEGVEAAVAAFERCLAASDSDLTGSITVTCPEADLYGVLTPLVDAFRVKYPGLRVDCIVTEDTLDLAKGEADVALRGGVPRDGTLIGRKLADVPWIVYASSAYIERHGRPERPEDLPAHKVIAYTMPIANLPPVRWFEAASRGAVVAVRSKGVLPTLSAVRSGLALGLLPVPAGDSNPDLVRVLEAPSGLEQPFTILVHPDLRNTPRVRAFFDFVVSEFAPYRALCEGKARK